MKRTAEEDSGAGVCGAMDMQPVCHQLRLPAGGRQNAAISTIPPSPASMLSLLHLSFHGGPRQTKSDSSDLLEDILKVSRIRRKIMIFIVC